MTTNDTPLKTTAIVNKLLLLRPKLNAPQAETQKPIANLRIESSNVTKEINKFRACDGLACFYCREWAQLLQRKHFPSASRIRKESMLAVSYSAPVPREKASDLCTKLLQRTQTKPATDDNPFISVTDLVEEWLHKTPSVFETINTIFSPISFDTSADHVPLNETLDNPIHILNRTEADRSHLTLDEKDFSLLRSITQNLVASHTTPDCFHSRPEDVPCAELESSRRTVNEDLEKVFKECSQEIEQSVKTLWQPVSLFLQEMKELELARAQAVGDGCSEKVSQFIQSHRDKLVGFNEFWTTVVESHKKKGKRLFSKGSSSDEVDASFFTFLKHMNDGCSLWYQEFLKPQIVIVRQFVQNLSQVCCDRVNTIQEELEDTREEKTRLTSTCLKKFIADVEAGLNKLQREFETRVLEIATEVDAIRLIWKAESQPTTQGRLEKAANKEFKKRIKRLETLSSSTRSWSISQLRTSITAGDLSDLLLSILEARMLEAERYEENIVSDLLRKYDSTIKEVTTNRENVWQEFVRGVNVGRSVLGSVLGKLFLREGLRQIEDRVAAHKEKWLLEQLEDGPSEVVEVKRKGRSRKVSELSSSIPEEVPKAKAAASSPVMETLPILEVDSDTETTSNGNLCSMPPTPVEVKTPINIESLKSSRNIAGFPSQTGSTPQDDLNSSNLIKLIETLHQENDHLNETLLSVREESTKLISQVSSLTQALRQQEEYSKLKEKEFHHSMSLKEVEMQNACQYVAAMEQRIALLERDHPIHQREPSRPSTPTLVAEISRLAYQSSISNLRYEIELSEDEDYPSMQATEQIIV